MKNTVIRNLENEYKIYTSIWGLDGIKYGICMRSFRIPQDDDVILSSFSYVSTLGFEI